MRRLPSIPENCHRWSQMWRSELLTSRETPPKRCLRAMWSILKSHQWRKGMCTKPLYLQTKGPSWWNLRGLPTIHQSLRQRKRMRRPSLYRPVDPPNWWPMRRLLPIHQSLSRRKAMCPTQLQRQIEARTKRKLCWLPRLRKSSRNWSHLWTRHLQRQIESAEGWYLQVLPTLPIRLCEQKMLHQANLQTRCWIHLQGWCLPAMPLWSNHWTRWYYLHNRPIEEASRSTSHCTNSSYPCLQPGASMLHNRRLRRLDRRAILIRGPGYRILPQREDRKLGLHFG
jgi:hypothetical protein